MKYLKHVLVIAAALFLTAGLPLLVSPVFQRMIHGQEVDGVSSASVILDTPSGSYVVMINRDRHRADTLEEWIKFFRGEEISVIFEDIDCMVSEDDAGGIELAESLQSRLPENQMKVTEMDSTLLLSRADSGVFDVVILSKEAADAYGAETAARRAGTEIVEFTDTTSSGAEEVESFAENSLSEGEQPAPSEDVL